ncbi:hypothetical protein BGX27_004913 [Mortierella sp. AM989]|nr:hypothetical protein BGX27_004913 [Mortierella sp. AM989]
MDLPEIRRNVGLLLTISELAIASAVCKSWNASFSSVLYSKIDWYDQSTSGIPSAEAIQSHASQIRILQLDGDPIDIPIEAITELEELRIPYGFTNSTNWERLPPLIKRNLNLTKADLNVSEYGWTQEIVKEMSLNMALKRLRLTAGDVDSQTQEYIFDTCMHLHRLSLSISNWCDGIYLDKWSQFPAISTLYLSIDSGLSPLQQLAIIQRCPKLETLYWFFSVEEFPTSEFCQVISTSCLQVKELTFHCQSPSTRRGFSDADLAMIFDSCREISSFYALDTEFSHLALHSLSRRFGSLTELDLSDSSTLTSTMVQVIMTSCPLLVTLSATLLEARDIVGDAMMEDEKQIAGEEAKGMETQKQPLVQDWVCVKLETLTLQICGLENKPTRWHRIIFQQLARLQNLEMLDINPYNLTTLYRDSLDLRLEAGLGALNNLKRLENLYFSGIRQNMEEQDLRWMLQAWPKLKHIAGNLHYSMSNRNELEKILEERGILVSSDGREGEM